jgi:SWIM zinc finger
MKPVPLNDGLPVVVPAGDDRIGSGAWARWFASAAVPDEGSERAARGRELARGGSVGAVEIAEGVIEGEVASSSGGFYTVSLETAPVPPTVWARVVREARGRPEREPGIEGHAQSIHLAHWMETELEQPLVPSSRLLRRSCTCPDGQRSPVCKHVAALAFVVAHAIDEDPSLLLRFRGCEPVMPRAARSADPWQAGPIPVPRPARALPAGAVVKRLGRSGIRVGDVDLSDALAPAYRAFAETASGSG